MKFWRKIGKVLEIQEICFFIFGFIYLFIFIASVAKNYNMYSYYSSEFSCLK